MTKKPGKKHLTRIANASMMGSVVSNKKFPRYPSDRQAKYMVRARGEDIDLVNKLKKKLGLQITGLFRLAIREMAESRGLR
jgi:hypothetical protein